VGNSSEGGCADVDVGFGLDLAGAADHSCEVLPDHFACQDAGIAGLRLPDHESNDARNDQNRKNDANDFFHILIVLRKSPLTVYATDREWVPRNDAEREGLGRVINGEDEVPCSWGTKPGANLGTGRN